MKILLVSPPFDRFFGASRSNYPLGLGYLSSYVSSRLDISVPVYNVDCCPESLAVDGRELERQDAYAVGVRDLAHPVWGEFRDTIAAHRPDLIGISVKSPMLPAAESIVRIVRDTLPASVTVVGGPHATLDAKDLLERTGADFAVRGEGEETFAALAQTLMSGGNPSEVAGLSFVHHGSFVSTPDRPLIADLDAFPFPERRNLLFRERFSADQFNVVVTSRGCPYRCTFCCAGPLWRHRVRYRSLENVTAEIETLLKDGYRKIFFWDDTFGSIPTRTIQLCQHLRRHLPRFFWSCTTRGDARDEMAKEMAKAGCVSVDLGLESGSSFVLNRICKGVTAETVQQGVKRFRRFGISVNIFLMVGFPFEREEDIQDTIRFVEQTEGVASYGLSCFTPYPGTQIYEEMVRDGQLTGNDLDWAVLSHHSLHNRFNRTMPEARFRQLFNDLQAIVDLKNRTHLFGDKIHRYWRMLRYSPGALVNTALRKYV